MKNVRVNTANWIAVKYEGRPVGSPIKLTEKIVHGVQRNLNKKYLPLYNKCKIHLMN